MSQIKLAPNASGTGIFTLESPNSNTNRTLSLPDNTGTIITTGSTFAGTGPAFSAYQNTSQTSLTASTWTKVKLDAEEFDTANCFDSTTNYRFTPTVAGYYQIDGAVKSTTGASYNYYASGIYKNGSLFKQGSTFGITSANPCTTVSALIYFNGSTDYVELYVITGNSSTSVETGASVTYFQGFLARAT